MALSSITVAGLTPDLNILGGYQRFIFPNSINSCVLGTKSTFVPTVGNDAITIWETRNINLNGYRWVHTTTSTGTFGNMAFQNFINSGAITDILATGEGGVLTIYLPVTMSQAMNMGGFKITNGATPTVSSDFATKGYVDGLPAGTVTLGGNVTGTGAVGTTITTTLALRLDQITAPSASVSLNSQKITNLATPTAGTDGVNKDYVDNRPYCNIIMAANATTTTVATPGTYVKVAGTTTLVDSYLFTSPSSNRITYTGTPTINTLINVTLSFTDSGTSGYETFMLYKNGSIASSTTAPMSSKSGGDQRSVPISSVVSLATNDYIEVFVTGSTGSPVVTVTDMNVVAAKV